MVAAAVAVAGVAAPAAALGSREACAAGGVAGGRELEGWLRGFGSTMF